MRRDVWTASIRYVLKKGTGRAALDAEASCCWGPAEGSGLKLTAGATQQNRCSHSPDLRYDRSDASNQWVQVLEQLATSVEKLVWSPRIQHQNKFQMDQKIFG